MDMRHTAGELYTLAVDGRNEKRLCIYKFEEVDVHHVELFFRMEK